MSASNKKPDTEKLLQWRKDLGPYARFVPSRVPIPDPFPPSNQWFEPSHDDSMLIQDELDQRLIDAEAHNRKYNDLLDRLLRAAERLRWSREAADDLAGIIQAVRFNWEVSDGE